MKIVVNGIVKETTDQKTLLDVLRELHLEDKVMAAAVNMEIIKQNEWGTRFLQEGDKLELLDFVGGG